MFQAESSLFKLHGSLLSSRSPVFHNILNWQNDPESSVSVESSGIFEGYPIIKLTDDGPDAKYFFLAIYDSGLVFFLLDIQILGPIGALWTFLV